MIRQPILLIIAAGALLFAGYFVIDRLLFLTSAQRTMGTVVSLSARDSRCGGKRKYSCTRFYAQVEFQTARGERSQLEVSAGTARGSNQPLTRARYVQGANVELIYDPKNPREVLQNSFFEIWGLPLMGGVFGGSFLFGSFCEPRRRYSLATGMQRAPS